MSDRPSALAAAFDEAVTRRIERISTVHERQTCAACQAPVGERCRGLPKGWRPVSEDHRGPVLKSPHRARLRADGIYER